MIVEKTEYEEYLRVSQPEFESRWENVKELVSYPHTVVGPISSLEQITYSVTVAADQGREGTDGVTNDDFMPANSEALKTLLAKVETAEERPDNSLHPIFRRLSSDSSSKGRPVVGRKVLAKGRKGVAARPKLEEEVIEITSSDEEEAVPLAPTARLDPGEADVTTINAPGDLISASHADGSRQTQSAEGKMR